MHRRAGRDHRQVGVPRPAGRPARPRDGGQGGGLRRGRDARSSRTTPPRSWPTPRRWPRHWPATACGWCRAAPTTTSCSSTCAPSTRSCPGKKARLALDRAGISLNENTVPDDPRPPYITSGLRIGTPAVTTQGMGEAEMATIAALIHRTLVGREDEAEMAAVQDEVLALCSKFTPYPTGLSGLVQDYLGTPVIGVAALVTLVTTPLFRRLSFRIDAVQARRRRVHTVPTPILGGAAILLGWLSGMFTAGAWRLRRRLRRLHCAARHSARCAGDVRRRAGRRPQGCFSSCQDSRDRAGRQIGHLRREHLVLPHPLRRAGEPVARHLGVADGGVGARHDDRETHRRARRPGRGHRGHRRGGVAPLLPAADSGDAIGPDNAGP